MLLGTGAGGVSVMISGEKRLKKQSKDVGGWMGMNVWAEGVRAEGE